MIMKDIEFVEQQSMPISHIFNCQGWTKCL